MSGETREVSIPETRERFIDRVRHVRESLLTTPREKREYQSEKGGKIRVFSQVCTVPESLKEKREDGNAVRISICMPGLSREDIINEGNVNDIYFAGGITEGDTDVLMIIKPEGLNKEAYVVEDGSPNRDTGRAAADTLLKEIQKLKETYGNKEIELRLVGESEGGSLVGSTVAYLLQTHPEIHITEIINICGGGFGSLQELGARQTVEYLKKGFTGKAESAAGYRNEMDGRVVKKISDRHIFIDGRLFGGLAKTVHNDRQEQVLGGLEGALGKLETNPKLADKNFYDSIRDLLLTHLGFARNLPVERLAAAFAPNSDWKTVAEAGIPTTVITSVNDEFFPSQDIEQSVNRLSQETGWKPTIITTSLQHNEYPRYPQAISGMVAMVTKK